MRGVFSAGKDHTQDHYQAGFNCGSQSKDDIITSAAAQKYIKRFVVAKDTAYNSAAGVSAQERENRQRLPIWRRVLLVLVVAAMVVVAGVIIASYVAQRRLGGEIVRISRAGEPVTFTDLRFDDQNQATAGLDAAGLYVEAVRQINPKDLAKLVQLNVFYRTNLVSLPASQFPSDLHEKMEQTLTNAKPMFAKLDKGASLGLSGYDIGIIHGNQACRTRLDSVEGTVFLLSLRTLDSILNRDGNEAAESIISTLKMMRVFDVQPTMLVQGRKIICVRLVCSDIQILLMYCNPSEKQLKEMQTLLQKSLGSDSLEKTLMAERVYQLEVARNILPKDVASKYLMADVPNLPERLTLPGLSWHRMRLYTGSLRYLHNLAWFITVAHKPWPEPLDEIMDANKTSSEKTNKLMSAVVPFSRLTAETLAFVRCTTTAVAIERYRHQNKKLPDSLNDILPLYIESVPLDPFTGKPLLYTRDGQSFTVYSTGFNRIDDGGVLVPKPDEPAAFDIGISIKRTAIK